MNTALQKLISQGKELLQEHPDDFALKLAVESLESMNPPSGCNVGELCRWFIRNGTGTCICMVRETEKITGEIGCPSQMERVKT